MTGPRPGGLTLVTGEALVDLVLRADGSLAAHPGGGPYNVARTIGRLEQPVAYAGTVSSDRFGARLREELAADGVALDAIVATDLPTTLALAELDAAGAAQYRFYAAETSSPALTAAALAGVLPDGIERFYLGTLGLVFEPLAATLEAAVGRLSADTLVALDPNCRPVVIADEPAYRARLARVLARADVVKVSAEDLAFLAPGRDAPGAARALLRDGAVALLTLGADGALVIAAGAERRVAPVAVDVVDTIGAGDAFMGAFLAWWSERGLGRAELADLDAVEGGARFAARVAALTCARAGADPPHRAEL